VRASGKGSLRLELERPARGAVIQRVAVPSDRRYRLTAKVRTEELKGEAYVSFFTGDVHSAQGKTEPVRLPSSRWRSYEARWFSGTSRVVYIACYLKGESGTVWFDDVELVEIP
ncbi:MAG: hypothetical protein ACE5GW_09205, partial [Planctomycetota bacterium]